MERLLRGASKLGLHLTSWQEEQFRRYCTELIEWNQRVNLTAITEPAEVETKHFLDSLTITLVLEESGIGKNTGFSVIDVGSGAGLPGVPLKIMFPQWRLLLLDSIAKKTAFLRHIVGRLELENVEIVTGRAEEIAHQDRYRERFALVLSRAVARLPSLVELALPLCQIGGIFVSQKKGEIAGEVARAASAINVLGGKLAVLREVEMEELGEKRYLVVVEKVSPTPQQYPRRPGIPTRRPL